MADLHSNPEPGPPRQPLPHILWPAPTEEDFARSSFSLPALTPEAVHVWAVTLDLPAAALDRLAAALSPAEQDRAARFHFALHQNRFIAGRGWLRAVLGRYLQTEPGKLEFVHGAYGKPALGGAWASHELQFNLAHCEDLALLAVTQAAPVGVDVERVRKLAEAEELVARFFSARESKAFKELAEAQQPEAFFNLWTRKEAWLKATGEGIAHFLREVEVSFLPSEPARLRSLPAHVCGDRPWTLHKLAPAPGFVAALAIAAERCAPRTWHWQPSEWLCSRPA